MYRTTAPSQSSIGRDFITFGHEALAVHRAMERRAAEINQNEIHAALRATRPAPWVRRWLGTLMISLGTGISGKAGRIQEREPARPACAPEAELAATR